MFNLERGYLGNPLLKIKGAKSVYGAHELEEYMKCAADPVYFIRTYVKIVNIDRGLISFDLYPFQEKMVRQFNSQRFSIIKCPRQVGKSITTMSYLLWCALFNENFRIAILANKEKTARALLAELKRAFEYLPRWLQQGIVPGGWNKGSIEFENGSFIISSSTSSSAVRGGTYNIVFLDEFAFVPTNIAGEFFNSVYPTITSGKTAKVIMVSTPKGMNMFFKMWSAAEKAQEVRDGKRNAQPEEKLSTYVPFSIHWRDVPGRDEVWMRETIANTSEEQFRQEFECEFLGSQNTLINPKKLQILAFADPIFDRDGLEIFEHPQDGAVYVLVADTSHGKDQDASAFVIVDITEFPYKVVAAYRDKHISHLMFPDVIYNIATKFNEAFILVELNDLGRSISDTLFNDLEYENMISVNTGVSKGGGQEVGSGFGKKVQFGVTTSKTVKKVGCSQLKILVEQDRLFINSFNIYEELTRFVSNGRGSYAADQNAGEEHHDDLVMCLVLFAWLSNQKYFKELVDVDLREHIKRQLEDNIEQDVPLFGAITSGTDEEPTSDNWLPASFKMFTKW